MMKFKRWKKMIVMLMVATMFLQSVVVYADDTMPSEPKTKSVQAAAEEESTTLDDISNQDDSDVEEDDADQADSDVEDDADDQADLDVEDDADDQADSDVDDDVDDQDDPDEKDSGEDSNKVTDSVKEEIKAFLDAVADAKLPTSIGTTEEYDTVQEKVSELLGRYDALSDKAKEDDGVKDAKSKLDELKEQSRSDMPAEVKAFLDAVAKLPSADEVTAENAEDIMEQLCGETLSDGYAIVDNNREEAWANREDVKDACAKYEAVFEAVKAVMAEKGFDQGSTFGVTNSVFGYHYKDGYNSNDFTYTGDYQYYAVTARGNVVIDSEDGAYDEGTPLLDPPYNATPGLAPVAGSYNQPIVNYSSSWRTSGGSSSSSNIATASVSWSGTKLKVTFKPGTQKGTVYVYVHVGLKWRDKGNFMDPGFDMPGNLYICYTVTNNVGSDTTVKPAKPTENSISNIEGYGVAIYCSKVDWHAGVGVKKIHEHPAGYTFSDVVETTNPTYASDYPWQSTMTLDGQYWVDQYNTDWADEEGFHYLDTSKPIGSTTLYSDGQNWYYVTGDFPLKVYVTCTAPVAQDTTYKVNREYYINGKMIATASDSTIKGKVGDKIVGATLADQNTNWKYYITDGVKREYEYKSSRPTELVLTGTATDNVITLRYETNIYTVKYTDGANGTVFGDETHGNLKAGAATPAFGGVSGKSLEVGNTTVRPGYTFMGWTPEVKKTIDPSMATNYVITYTATWQEETPEAPTKEQAADILNGKYIVKVKCTNGSRPHTLAEKDYSITAADITSISEVTKNDTSGKWEVEVRSTNQNFVDKFEKESNVNCDHNDVPGGFGVKLVWNGSAWTYEGTNTHTVATECHKPDKPTYEEVRKLIGAAVKVVCDTENKENSSFGYSLNDAQKARVTIGDVKSDGKGGYTCDVTFIAQKFCDAYNSLTSVTKNHTLAQGQNDVTLKFTWDAVGNTWKTPSGFESPVTIHVVCETTKTPIIEVKKSNTNFKVDSESGNAKVDYTVTIKNVSGFDIYGLKLTDTLKPTLTKKGNVEGTPEATYTFSNWKVDKKGITPIKGTAEELTHELGLLPRNTIFKDNQTVTLTYTVEIEANDVPVEVKLENKADVDSWSEVYTPSKLAKVAAALFMKTRTADDDIGYPDEPDIHGSATSTTGGDVSGSGSSTAEGELPAKYTLTYAWNLPEGATPARTLPTDTRNSRPAGSHFTVDTANKKGDEVTVDGRTYVFSGWEVPDNVVTESEEGDYKGQYVMPDQAVVITGEWTLKEDVPEKPTKEDLQQVGVAINCSDDSNHNSGTVWQLGGEVENNAVRPYADEWRTIGEVTKNGDTYQCIVTLHAVPWADMRINGSTLTKIKEEKGIEHIFDEVKTGGKEIPVTFTYENGTWTADKKTVEVWLKENYMYTVTVNHLGDNGHNFWTGYDPTYGLKVGENYNHSFDESMTALQYPNKPDVKSPKAFDIREYHFVLDPMADNTPEDELKGIMGKENVIINLYYSLDVKGGDDPDKPNGGPDGIPDKYQTKVTFKVVNGNWNDDTENDVIKYVVKYKEVDGKQVMAADGTATLDGITIPEAGDKPDLDFKAGAWDTEPTKYTKLTSDATYTYIYAKDNTVTITIKFVDEDGNEVGRETKSVEKGSEYDVTKETKEIPEDYESNGEPEGDVSGIADTNKIIIVPVKKITYTVTYTDGVNGAAFANQETPGLNKGVPTPAFVGTPSRSGYTFEGWTPVVADIVTDNATYTAQWTLIPENPTTPTPGGGDDPTPTPPGGGGGGGTGGGGGGTPDPTPTPPIPEITPLIPEIVPAVGPTTTVVPNVTPVAATPVAPTPTAALVSPTPKAVELADEAVPLAAEEEKEQPEPVAVDEEETPLAGGKGAAWALINFALMNLAIFESVMLLIGYFVKTKNDEEEEKRKLKKKGIFRVISLPIAIISLIVFILTEDITLPTAFVDKYTIVMLIIAIVQTVMVVLSNKKYEDEEEA